MSLLTMCRHYSYRDAVARLGEMGISLSERTLKRLVKERRLACRRPGGRVVIGEDQLQDYLYSVTEEACQSDGSGEPRGNTGSTQSTSRESSTPTGTTRRLDASAAKRLALEIVGEPKRDKPKSSLNGQP